MSDGFVSKPEDSDLCLYRLEVGGTPRRGVIVIVTHFMKSFPDADRALFYTGEPATPVKWPNALAALLNLSETFPLIPFTLHRQVCWSTEITKTEVLGGRIVD